MLTQHIHCPVDRRGARAARTRRALALLLPVVAIAGAWTYEDGRIAIAPESRLWVEGTSTVRSFKCDATQLDGAVGYQGELGGVLEAVGRAIDAVEIAVPVPALDCRNGTMNEHMRKALKAGEHPVIRYRMTSHEIVPRADGSLTVELVGTLTLAGREKEIAMTAEAVRDSSGRYRITGSEELNMSEFGIKPPTLMLGTLKVHDKIVVRYEVVLASPRAVAAGR
jgi:polyisoprenoid-binding protein YceI